MIGRKAARTLALAYHARFKGQWFDKSYKLLQDDVYDFLFDREHETWYLNAIKALPTNKERSLQELIMRLHTGESVYAWSGWTWPQRLAVGQKVLLKLAENILSIPRAANSYNPDANEVKRLISELELDGYVFRDGRLYKSESDVLDTEAEVGILEHLAATCSLTNQDVIKHHLQLSSDHYIDGRWDDSISNSRKVWEAVYQEIAAKHCLEATGNSIDNETYTSPGKVRKYLEKQGLMTHQERESFDTVYGLLSATGGHPHIAKKDQARLMRHLALTLTQFGLLQFQGYLASKAVVTP